MDWADGAAWKALLLSGGWGRAASAGDPRGRRVLGVAAIACGTAALAGALAASQAIGSELGWYGPREVEEVGTWLLVQWSAMYGLWVCGWTALAGLACGIASLAARWSLGLSLAGTGLSLGAAAATVNTYGMFFWNHF
ncbi:hypothetical protein [Sinomonas halotolerans]|uniref:Uncharacterized protein n=1 Tax=Sinomonas halotolerans TaxID=1644133 RepID=A0ABU9WXF4_9MICC